MSSAPDDVKAAAVISECGRYRYRLLRQWSSDRFVLFVMLNPSTADASQDDPTIRRCIGFAKSWGFGGLRVGNLFAWRATDPSDLKRCSDPTGPDNDHHLLYMARQSDTTVCAWGRHGEFRGRDRSVLRLLPQRRAVSDDARQTGQALPDAPAVSAGYDSLSRGAIVSDVKAPDMGKKGRRRAMRYQIPDDGGAGRLPAATDNERNDDG